MPNHSHLLVSLHVNLIARLALCFKSRAGLALFVYMSASHLLLAVFAVKHLLPFYPLYP